jgi:copper transport protein
MLYPLVRALAGVLLLIGMPRPVAAAPCAGEVRLAPPVVPATQVFSATEQPATNLFVCRVDGAGLLAPGPSAGAATRSLTSSGLALLVLARWLHFAGYALGFGAVAFSLWAGAALRELRLSMARLWRLVNIGIVLLLCAEPLALLAQTIGVGAAPFDPVTAGDVLASGFGLVWAQRVGVALLLWVVVGVVRDGASRAIWGVPALALVLAAIDVAASGRAGAIAIAAAALHQAAMGAWVGGLALWLACWGSLGSVRPAALLARFRQLSVAAIGVLMITGLAMSAPALAQPGLLIESLYGAVLAAKLLGALVSIGLVVLGWRVYRDLWRWRSAFAALIVVLGVAGLLVSLPSP